MSVKRRVINGEGKFRGGSNPKISFRCRLSYFFYCELPVGAEMNNVFLGA